MTDYNRSEAYDLSLFAEPAIEPTPEPQRRQQPVRQPQEGARHIRRVDNAYRPFRRHNRHEDKPREPYERGGDAQE